MLAAAPRTSVGVGRRYSGLADYLRSVAVRRAIDHLLVISSLLVSLVVVAVDHHGAERIATHVHLTADGGKAPAHVHAFQQAHMHDWAALDMGRSIVAMFQIDASTDSLTSIPGVAIGTLLLLALLSAAARSHRLRCPEERLLAQFTLRPPVPPPAI
jgi:hypothetical protein